MNVLVIGGNLFIGRLLVAELSDLHFDKRTEFVAFLRGNIHFEDGSLLHFRELVDVEFSLQKVAYSYHYQHTDGEVLFRYDNAPHFPNLSTAPHHKHVGSETNVVAANPPTLATVLHEVEVIMRANLP